MRPHSSPQLVVVLMVMVMRWIKSFVVVVASV